MGKTRQDTKRRYYAAPDYDEPVVEATAGADPTPFTPERWTQDCEQWRGVILTGTYVHWCPNWNYLPMDETCPEWPCQCGIEQDIDVA